MIGELIDHYRVLELVGRGAMGVVYKGLDVNLDRQVAIKVMSAEARNDPDFVERFRQEARMQGALNHPNVALLFDYFIHDGTPVAVMEFIDGESLEQLIRRRGAIPVRESIPIFKQALRGVAAAHRAGIIHRDLKPSNLMITKDDIVKVMDFGIAKRQNAPGATKVSSTSIGSPLYMAPEQILGRAVDCRTDVYALGLTLYELLSGNRPFNPRGKAEYMVLNAHVNDMPEPPTVYRFGLPQPIVDAVMRALAKDPAARFQSADEFMSALPDVPAAAATAPSAAARRVGPTGTVALGNSPPQRGNPAATPREASATTVLEHAPSSTTVAPPVATVRIARPGRPVAAPEPTGTTVFEYTPSATRAQAATVKITPSDTSLAGSPDNSSATSSPSPSGLVQLLRGHRLGLAAALVAALVLSTLLRHPEQATTQTPPATEPAAPPPADTSATADAHASPADGTAATAEQTTAALAPPAPATAAAAVVTPLATTTVPASPALAGTWRGAYVDASGKQLLRVVNLSISRVYDDGGIEGTLQYQAASGDGECQLHPRGSSYSAPERRLQLSPESCTPHYPKELGVPLDFDGVSPRTNTLRNGRIEAPTGAVIRVRLQRVSGA